MICRQSLRSSKHKIWSDFIGERHIFILTIPMILLILLFAEDVVNLASLSGSTGKDGFLVGFGDKILCFSF